MYNLDVSELEGAHAAKNLAVVSFTLVAYEYASTINEEVEYFWKGPWSLSCALFLYNRYSTLANVIYILALFFSPGLTTGVCTPAAKIAIVQGVLSITLVQAILVLRIWYLYTHSTRVQILVVAIFLATTLATFIFLAEAFIGLHSIAVPGIAGCGTPPTTKMWRIFVPALFIHTVLYMFTAYRAIRNKQFLKSSPVLMSLLRDGGLFYLVIFLVAGFTAVGAFFVDVPRINLPAIYSGFVFGVSSIAVSRLMLNLRSLAARLGSNEAFLLNNVELSRVEWRWGAHEGEILVDVRKDIEDDIELLSFESRLNCVRGKAVITTTRIGMLAHSDP